MITGTAFPGFSALQNIMAAGIRMFELYKLSCKAGKCKKEEDCVVKYIQNSINKGDTVIDIGSCERNLYFMRKKLKDSGRIIVFECEPYFYQHRVQLKKMLDWKNVEVKLTRLYDTTRTLPVYNTQKTRSCYTSPGAVVININERVSNYPSVNITVQTLDNYCMSANVQPRFLKIDAGGNELRILTGAINTLRRYKPKLLLKCEERLAGAESILETFKFLLLLNYTGYFVLDTMRIPLANFDCNVYQNPCKNFYCSDFMFE